MTLMISAVSDLWHVSTSYLFLTNRYLIEFVWDCSQETAFKNVNAVLTEAPVLAYYDPNKPITLQIDASKYGIGSSLLQDGKPVAYASKTLTQAEIHYTMIEQEPFAILFSVRRFEQYIYGKACHRRIRPQASVFNHEKDINAYTATCTANAAISAEI